jgi:putative transposase
MGTKLVTEKYWASQWMEIIKDRKDSGLGVDEYCKINGISRHAYYYWQRKLRKAACTELASETPKASQPPQAGCSYHRQLCQNHH